MPLGYLRPCSRRGISTSSARHSPLPRTPDEEALLERLQSRNLGRAAGPFNAGNSYNLTRTLRPYLHPDAIVTPGLVFPGYHQASFVQAAREDRLGEDGADAIHAPGEEWKYRVWAGGFLSFHSPHFHPTTRIVTNERFKDVRIHGDLQSRDAKIFVTLQKFFNQDRRSLPQQDLRAPPARSALIMEEKRLCFMRHIPDSFRSADKPRALRPPSDPSHSYSIVPTRTLLFRFSALTMNDHAIHLNPEYTKAVYGFPDLIVHGPLTYLLMLELLRTAVAIGPADRRQYIITHFDYKNLQPVFVGEKIIIACKQLEDSDPPSMSKSRAPSKNWSVWIQKNDGDDANLAVKATATLRPFSPAGADVTVEEGQDTEAK